MRKPLLPLVLVSLAGLAAGCGSDSAGPDGSRRYSVQYDVTGTFSTCTVFYITRRADVAADEENQGGDSRSEEVSVPWSHSFDVTVTQLHPFNTQVGAVCSASASETVTATVRIDGSEADSDTRSGQNVNAQAAVPLSLGG